MFKLTRDTNPSKLYVWTVKMWS